MMEAKGLSPDSYHAPDIQDNDTECNDVEHRFGTQLVLFLSPPESINTNFLSSNANDNEVGEFESVVGDDAILESCYHRHGCVEGVTEEEIADQIDERLLEVPDLSESAVELPDAHSDNVHSG
jgi:hypothetical protein